MVDFSKEDLVHDGWTEIFRNLTGIIPPDGHEKMTREEIAAATEIADFQKMEKIRHRAETLVRDSKTAEALKPYYRQFCKRPCFHDEYLDTYNRPNVKLIDTEGRGVERITERAVVVAGKPYEIDCLIFATDFEVGTGYTRQSGYDVIGRNGRRLSEEWANGLITFHGLHSEGFPNCYFMGMTQTGSTPNFPHMLNEQSKHIAYIVRHATTEGLCVIEARPRLKMSGGTPFIDSHIVGHVSLRSVLPVTTTTKGGPVRTLEASSLGCMAMGQRPFFQLLRQWREEGNLNGLQCRK